MGRRAIISGLDMRVVSDKDVVRQETPSPMYMVVLREPRDQSFSRSRSQGTMEGIMEGTRVGPQCNAVEVDM